MLKKAVKLLRGSVCVRAKSAYPERMLNLCSARGIEFWDVRWIDDTALSFCVARGDLRALRRAAEGCGAEVSIERTAGTPFFFARLRRRPRTVRPAAFCVRRCCSSTRFSSGILRSRATRPSRLRRFCMPCASTASTAERSSIRSARRISATAFCRSSRDLCWVADNVRGCKASAGCASAWRAPERVNESEPTNVIAAKRALITKVRALDGEKRVLPGTSVQQGQLLIAGVVDTGGTEKPSVTTRFLAGKGEVWARTWYDLTVRVPLTYEKKVYTGKEKRSHTLIWGENRLKIGAKGSSICNVDCDKIKNQTQWTLFGLFALPVTWETETLLPYELEVTPRSRADAEAQGKDMLETYLAALLGETGSVTQRRFSTAVEGDTLVVTLSAECEEQIGKEVPIAVSEDNTVSRDRPASTFFQEETQHGTAHQHRTHGAGGQFVRLIR